MLDNTSETDIRKKCLEFPLRAPGILPFLPLRDHFLFLSDKTLLARVWFLEADSMPASGFGGLGVACWPLVPKFAGSNPAEAKKSSARLPSEGK